MFARAGAVAVLLMMGSLLFVLIVAAIPSIRTFGLKFLVERTWRPNEREVPDRDASGKLVKDEDGELVMKTLPMQFGALPVIYGTVVSSGVALLFAVPLSLGAAVFLLRICPRPLVNPVSFLVEFLAAIPSIAYGFWGVYVLAPFLQAHVEPGLNGFFRKTVVLRWLSNDATTGRDMFCASLVLAIMIIPIITAVSRDVLRAVPRAQIEGTQALGATWWQTSRDMLRYSRSGLFGAIMLGLARAAGETMAVTMVIGNVAQIKTSLFAPAQTMSSLLANEFAEAGSDLQRSALLELALVLLVMSLAFNIVARFLVVGRQSRGSSAH